MRNRRGLYALCLILLVTMTACSGGGQTSSGMVPSNSGASAASTARHAAVTSQAASSQFVVTSTTFTNNSRVPASMVFKGTLGSVCTGGNRSPQLSWNNAPGGTRSFAVIVFDSTANFAHWGIYNIPSTTTSLPENAGAGGNSLGIQVNNDAQLRGYSGPCPPPGLNHRYVFTVYALDSALYISSSAMFPSNVESVLWSMQGHVLAKGFITGFFST